MKTIDLFLIDNQEIHLNESGQHNIFHIVSKIDNSLRNILSHYPLSSDTLLKISEIATSSIIALQVKPGILKFDMLRLIDLGTQLLNSDASFAYSGYIEEKQEDSEQHNTIDYQQGSIRDDFDFGPLVIIKTKHLKEYFITEKKAYKYAGWYDLRLFLTRIALPLHIENTVYSYNEKDLRLSGQKQFDYVNPQNRDRQIEMEHAATQHLEKIGAKVSPPFASVNFDEEKFDNEASVIIPVLNREKTIADAIKSVLSQRTNFPFNLVIIDNHSTDKTSKIIKEFNDSQIIHYIPERTDLGIGGCWNEGVQHRKCGRFAIQLDSDDLYINEHTLQRIVDKFYEEKCAMVVGSYQMVNFKLEEIPPGIIDHKEWTNHNGPNNALRINGLGAPRAFYTPLIRKIKFPNVSYGEDYAVGLALSRTYKIGRIYEPLYLCRRWDENTDSNLSIEKINMHNYYKDSLRSLEIKIRTKVETKNS